MTILSLSRAGTEDLERLMPMIEAFMRFEHIPCVPEHARRVLGRLLADPNIGMVFVLEDAGAPIGYAIVTFGFDLEYGGRDAYLTDLFVVAEHRDRGRGRHFLTEIEDEVRRTGVHALHLLVRPENARARHVYEEHGFDESPRLFMTKFLSR